MFVHPLDKTISRYLLYLTVHYNAYYVTISRHDVLFEFIKYLILFDDAFGL